MEDGEKMESSLKHSVKKELGVFIRVVKKLASVDHAYTHFRIKLHTYESILLKGDPKALGCQEWRWATPSDLNKLPLSKIDRMVIAVLSSLSR